MCVTFCSCVVECHVNKADKNWKLVIQLCKNCVTSGKVASSAADIIIPNIFVIFHCERKFDGLLSNFSTNICATQKTSYLITSILYTNLCCYITIYLRLKQIGMILFCSWKFYVRLEVATPLLTLDDCFFQLTFLFLHSFKTQPTS